MAVQCLFNKNGDSSIANCSSGGLNFFKCDCHIVHKYVKCIALHQNLMPRIAGMYSKHIQQYNTTAPEFIPLSSEGIRACPLKLSHSPHFTVQNTKCLLCSQQEKKNHL